MRRLVSITALLTLLLTAAAPAFAQTASEFYVGLLRRGMSAVEAGKYDTAASPLRIAAFGLVEQIELYETSLVYLAIAHERLNNTEGARDAARRVVAAERIERKFSSIALPGSIRTAFETIARKYMTPVEVASLSSAQTSATGTIPAPAQPRTPPAPQTQVPTPQTQTQPPAVKAEPVKPEAVIPQKVTPPPPPPPPATAQPGTATQSTTPPSSTPQSSTPQSSTTQSSTTQPRATTPQATVTPPATRTPPPTTARNPQQTTQPQAQPQRPPLSARDVAARLATAERALTGGQLNDARRIYRELVETPGIDRETLLRAAEGFYRARDFAGALSAFTRLGALKRGEEPYRYYIAVALYETGEYEAARRELAAAIPFIELTPDVVRYRAKIDGALP